MFRKSQLVFYSGLGFICGVGLASFVTFNWLVLYCLVLICLLAIIFFKIHSLTGLLALVLLFLVLGVSRYQLSLPKIDEGHLAFYHNQEITFTGVISQEPDIRKDHIKYHLEAGGEFKGKVLVKAALFPKYDYGDLLQVNCLLQPAEPIEDFRYDKYLALSDIYTVCYRGQIKLLDQDQGNIFQSFVLKIKGGAVEIVSRILPEPQSSFLGGLLWGAKKGLPEDILENFNVTGVTHIIAVSGYNITIIAVILTNFFINLGLSRKKAFWFIVLGIAFFVVITGSPASIVRAGIMGLVALISQTVGRATKMQNTLVIVCLVMLLINPKVLIWDAGFQLSFLATIGLIYLVPVLEKYTGWLPKALSIRESLTTTMSAIILTSPLIIFQFHKFSFVAPIANLLILPAIPLNMALGFLAVVAGWIYLPLGQLIGYVVWATLSYVLLITELLAKIPWASLGG